MMQIKFGSRQSKWALAATHSIVTLLTDKIPAVSIEVLSLNTPGDSYSGDLVGVGGTKSFVDKISLDVVSKKIDAAVHTVKDISWPDQIELFPSAIVTEWGLLSSDELIIPAVSRRSDPRDALVFRANTSFDTLKQKSEIIVGTSSLVRAEFFKRLYPSEKTIITPIRGNIDQRLEKLDAGDYDILILSMDGLLAIGQEKRANSILEVDQMPPAPGQAIGAVEVRLDHQDLISLLNQINDQETLNCLRAEWSLMKALNVTCNTPLGGICQIDKKSGDLILTATLVNSEGKLISATARQKASEPPELMGQTIAEQLLKLGAQEFTDSWIGKNNGLSQDAC